MAGWRLSSFCLKAVSVRYARRVTTAERIAEALAAVEVLDEITESLDREDADAARDTAARARDAQLREAPPVPVAEAARLLGVSTPTVRAWAGRGVVEMASERPLKLTLASVHAARRQLSLLRASGSSRAVVDALAQRLEDDEFVAKHGAELDAGLAALDDEDWQVVRPRKP